MLARIEAVVGQVLYSVDVLAVVARAMIEMHDFTWAEAIRFDEKHRSCHRRASDPSEADQERLPAIACHDQICSTLRTTA